MSGTQKKIAREAADWVARMHFEECSDATLAALTAWMETSEAHAQAYATALVLWSEKDDAQESSPLSSRFPLPAAFRKRSLALYAAGLTGLAVAIIAGLIWLPKLSTPMTRYETLIGGQQEVVLADGTDLILKTNTRVSVRLDETQRIVRLNHGEINIEVGEKSNVPLTVVAGDILIRNVGEQLSVSRLNGVVRVVLQGGEEDDLLSGGSENDNMYGGDGNDVYVVENAGDRVYENAGEGHDTVKAAIDYALSPEIESLYLIEDAVTGAGNALANTLNGSNVDNVLSGLGGDDNLFGWGGDDRLLGGYGDDTLVGGAGADTFVFLSTPINGHDHIVDFMHGVDRLAFTGAAYGFAPGHTLTDEEFTVGTTAVGPMAQFVWDATAHRLYFDADGEGGAEAVVLATIDHGAELSKEDVVIS
jgi:Ca2+-binding RTX toxin-like protein